MRSVLVLLSLLCLSLGANITTTFGSSFSVQANTQTQVKFGLWTGYLMITTNANANVTLALSANLPINTLPSGYRGLGLSAGVALVFTVQPATVAVDAYLATGELSAEALIILAVSGRRPSTLYFDATANAYVDLDLRSYSLEEGIKFDLPFSGTYAIVAVDTTAVNPALLGIARRIRRAERRTIRYLTRVRDAFLDLALTTGANATLTVNEKTTTTRQLPGNLTSVNIYFDIDLDIQTSVNATVAYKWAANQFANVTDYTKNLVWAYWNTATNQWVVVKTTIDVQASVVSTATTHFSEWGLYVQSDSDDESSASVYFVSTLIAAAIALVL